MEAIVRLCGPRFLRATSMEGGSSGEQVLRRVDSAARESADRVHPCVATSITSPEVYAIRFRSASLRGFSRRFACDATPPATTIGARVIGSIIQGKYRIDRLLGEGGMGAVYLAQDLHADRRVALKMLSCAAPASATLVERFHRESQAARSIDSPHIARVFDAGTDPRGPFLIMEHLEGEDLSGLFGRLHDVPPTLALRIVGQACAGLASAHAAGVVHRDIKPPNLFLARGERGHLLLKILDFGVAKMTPSWARGDVAPEVLTRTGAVLGSPLYMSPEQARGVRAVDHRSDIWSVGVVLYQALTGQVPHQEIEALGELIVTLCTQAPRPVEELSPWVSEGTAAIVARALRLDPADRFQSAGAMLDAIRVELGDEPTLHDSLLVRLPGDERARAFERLEPVPSTIREPPRHDTSFDR